MTNPDLAADSAKLERPKPCYCLGWETIRRVAEEGQLDTEHVAFVAADDLFHFDFTAREQRLVQVVVERAKVAIRSVIPKLELPSTERPTIEELEALINSEPLESIQINPDGSIDMKQPDILENCLIAIDQLSSPENVAAMIAEAKGEK